MILLHAQPDSKTMTDNMSKESRSYTMSRIRSKGNASTELVMLSIIKHNRIKGWRRHQNLKGRPDFIFKEKRVAVFIDGCFWHGCPRCYHPPKTNEVYWNNKISRNRERDKRITKELALSGWKVVRFWEHSLQRPEWVANKLILTLQHNC